MPALSIMVKPASGHCNMKCEYCFYSEVVGHRQEGQLGFMTKETTDNLIEKTLNFGGGENISFVFQGGEPLLCGIKYFKHFVDKVKSYNYKGKVYYSLQTNGTLLTEEWGEFFKENNFLIGVSLDGDLIANKFRVMGDKSPAFDKIMSGIEVLDKCKVDYNILSVVTGYFADNVEHIYKYFKDKGFKFLQFIPCLRPFGYNSKNEMFMTEKQYQNYLIKGFKLFAKDFLQDNYISVRNFDNFVRMYGGVAAEQCGMNGYCSRQFVIEGNGNIYPCDFYSEDKWLLGNINEVDFRSVYYSEKGIEFIKESYTITKKCKSCECLKVCHSCGCKREKVSYNYCNAYRNFYKKSKPLFEEIMVKLRVKK